MTPQMLLTGFGPFADVRVNPSMLLTEALARGDRRIEPHFLRVDVESAPAYLERLYAARFLGNEGPAPSLVVHLGVEGQAEGVRLERVALNLNDFEMPDVAGRFVTEQPIDREGPAAYISSLPLKSLCEAATGAGVTCKVSNSAGAYLCNHVYYFSRRFMEKNGLAARVLFIHVPTLEKMALDTALRGVKAALEVLFAMSDAASLAAADADHES